ncbi:MAG: hypothetical protein KME38_30995 [Spirirestis rafaelensis WJT71-NPBG6]|jgi:fatty acid desaturase|nr:hypothetical protein [Spirirestis rafaelensis WJT71-NPBG6]
MVLLGHITVVPLMVPGITVAVIAVGIAAAVMAAVLVVAVMVVVLAVVMVAVLAVAVMVAVLAVEDIKRANFLLDNFPFPALIAYVESRRCLTTRRRASTLVNFTNDQEIGNVELKSWILPS